MKERVLVAGATGAIGLPLCDTLVKAGYEVFGITRKPEGMTDLEKIGVMALQADVYDPENLAVAVSKADAGILIHQLTDLPYGLPADKMPEALKRNERIRLEGTANLLAALPPGRTRRLIVQSIAFAYADGDLPHREKDQLASAALRQFENSVIRSGIPATILRYGKLYGPRTGFKSIQEPCRISVSDAVAACLAVLRSGAEGIFNVTEDGEYADSSAFAAATGWRPAAVKAG